MTQHGQFLLSYSLLFRPHLRPVACLCLAQCLSLGPLGCKLSTQTPTPAEYINIPQMQVINYPTVWKEYKINLLHISKLGNSTMVQPDSKSITQ